MLQLLIMSGERCSATSTTGSGLPQVVQPCRTTLRLEEWENVHLTRTGRRSLECGRSCVTSGIVATLLLHMSRDILTVSTAFNSTSESPLQGGLGSYADCPAATSSLPVLVIGRYASGTSVPIVPSRSSGTRPSRLLTWLLFRLLRTPQFRPVSLLSSRHSHPPLWLPSRPWPPQIQPSSTDVRACTTMLPSSACSSTARSW